MDIQKQKTTYDIMRKLVDDTFICIGKLNTDFSRKCKILYNLSDAIHDSKDYFTEDQFREIAEKVRRLSLKFVTTELI